MFMLASKIILAPGQQQYKTICPLTREWTAVSMIFLRGIKSVRTVGAGQLESGDIPF
jgi:hypothetical protein